jgi:hypothetical protein
MRKPTAPAAARPKNTKPATLSLVLSDQKSESAAILTAMAMAPTIPINARRAALTRLRVPRVPPGCRRRSIMTTSCGD